MDIFDILKRLFRIAAISIQIPMLKCLLYFNSILPLIQRPPAFTSSWMQVGRALHRHILREWYHIAKKGQKAPNPKLMSSDGATHLNLMDVKKKHRPLVVNFGSCS